jgi:tetratricopeptide (TPR) repeat protein
MTSVLFRVRHLALVIGLASAAVHAGPSPAAPQVTAPTPGSRVLVMPFSADVSPDAAGGPGAALWLGEAAALLISDGLSSLGFGALPREERVLAFDRLQLPMPAVLTRATMIRVGEIIGASEIVYGEVSLGDTLRVRAHTIDLSAGRQLPEVADDAPLAEIFPLFRRVAGRIAGGALPTAPGESASSTALPLEVFENYVKGLVASTPAAQRRFLEQALVEASSDARILTALWSVYTGDGDHELALAAASAVPEDDPVWRRSRFLVALSLIDLRRLDGAFQTLTALGSEKASPAAANALGIVQLRRAPPEPASAATYFARAAEAEPGNTDYLFNRGYALALAGDDSSALFWLREAVRYDAANGEAHLVMAAMLSKQGRTAEARRELELARLLGAPVAPGGAAIPVGLEHLATALDSPGVARAEAAIASPAQSDQKAAAVFHLEQGRRLVAGRRDREALGELRRAIYLAPYEDEPHLLLGGLYRRAGRLEDAIDELKVAIWCRETAAARVALGEALLEHGDAALARQEAERALALTPSSAEARDLLRRAGGRLDAPEPVLPSDLAS